MLISGFRAIPIRRVLSIFIAFFLVGCASPAKRNGTISSYLDSIQASSSEGQIRFDEAKQLLEQHQYAEAEEAFRLLQAEFGSEEIANLAELYLARALMADIEESQPGNRADESPFLLASLMADRKVDERIRFAAQMYYALDLTLREKREEALTILYDYPGPSISPVVLGMDAVAVWPILAESFYRAGRFEDALVAYDRLFNALEKRSDDEGVAFAGGKLRDYALTRAFEISHQMLTPAQLQSFLSTDSAFLRAAAGWALIKSESHRGDQYDRESLEALFDMIGVDFSTIQAESRLAELSLYLSTLGGPQRLAIGVLVPLSGSHRHVGQRVLAGLLLAQRAFHYEGEPATTLIIQDSNQDIRQAFTTLINQGARVVIGPIEVNKSQELVAIASKSRVPVISMAAEPFAHQSQSELEVSEERGVFVFRNFVDSRQEARAIAQLSFETLKSRRVAIAFPDIGYGRLMEGAFSEAFKALGGQVVASVPYDRSQTDFATTAKSIAASRPDAVFIPDTAGKVAELSAFLAHENVWGLSPEQRPPADAQRTFVHYLGTSLWQDPILIRQSSNYVRGAVYPAWFDFAFDTPDIWSFGNRFNAVYGRSPQNFEAFAYDSLRLVRRIIIDERTYNSVAIRDAFLKMPEMVGVTGPFRFASDGEALRQLRFLTVHPQGIQPLVK